jgi:outer membrane protein assembly factor BamB
VSNVLVAFGFALLLLVSIVVFNANTIQALTLDSDWPMFHHDSARSGYSPENLPIDLVCLWNFSAKSVVISDVVVSHGYVYFTTFGNPPEDKIFALNASTGSLIWASPTSVPPFGGSSPTVLDDYVYTSTDAYDAFTGKLMFNYSSYGGSTSPTVAQGLVYIGSSTNAPSGPGGVFALDAITGECVWNFTGAKGNFPFGGKLFHSPAVADGIVYFSSGGGVYALNASTGRQMWHNSAVNASLGSLGCIAVGNGRVFDNVQGHLYCLDALTGNELWSYPIGAAQVTPAIADGYVYAGAYKLDASNGEVIWNNTLLALSSPSIACDKIYSAYYNLTNPGPNPTLTH